jgi:hypothetical protein
MDPRLPDEYTVKAALARAIHAPENHHGAGPSDAALQTW